MPSTTAPLIDFNVELDYERAVAMLKRNAVALYRQYHAAKADPGKSEEDCNQILKNYGETIEATKTLRPNDSSAIRAILAGAA